MPRQPRINLGDEIYHVINRANSLEIVLFVVGIAGGELSLRELNHSALKVQRLECGE